MRGTATVSTEGNFCGRAVRGVSNLGSEQMREIEAHRAKDRPTPWAHLALWYGVNEIDLRMMFAPAPERPRAVLHPPVDAPSADYASSVWNPRRIEILSRMWCDTGCTVPEIADALRLSAAAVVGKIRRLDLTKGPVIKVGGNALRVIDAIAERHGLTRTQILSPSSRRCYALPRMEAMYEVRKATSYGLEKLGSIFGGRHHTTILDGIRKHEARLAWAEFLIAAGRPPEQIAMAA